MNGLMSVALEIKEKNKICIGKATTDTLPGKMAFAEWHKKSIRNGTNSRLDKEITFGNEIGEFPCQNGYLYAFIAAAQPKYY